MHGIILHRRRPSVNPFCLIPFPGRRKVTVMSGSGLYARIMDIVRQVPEGRVATYGQIARLAGSTARQVGYALAALPEGDPAPWQRIVNREGRISLRTDGPGHDMQRTLLLAEGVVFDAHGRIDLKRFLWENPADAPSRAAGRGNRIERSSPWGAWNAR